MTPNFHTDLQRVEKALQSDVAEVRELLAQLLDNQTLILRMLEKALDRIAVQQSLGPQQIFYGNSNRQDISGGNVGQALAGEGKQEQ